MDFNIELGKIADDLRVLMALTRQDDFDTYELISGLNNIQKKISLVIIEATKRY